LLKLQLKNLLFLGRVVRRVGGINLFSSWCAAVVADAVLADDTLLTAGQCRSSR
jgi:hypothetical protein